MHLKKFKYISFLLFYLFSLGFLFAGDDPIAGADANPQLPRRGILVLHELRGSLDEVIKENEKLNEHKCLVPEPHICLPDPKVKKLEDDLETLRLDLEFEKKKLAEIQDFSKFLLIEATPTVIAHLRKYAISRDSSLRDVAQREEHISDVLVWQRNAAGKTEDGTAAQSFEKLMNALFIENRDGKLYRREDMASVGYASVNIPLTPPNVVRELEAISDVLRIQPFSPSARRFGINPNQ